MEERETVALSNHPKFIYRLLKFIGPAYLISVGYMDPGNWATDIAGGSQYGYTLIWVLVLSNLIALLFQSFCVKLGIVTKLDLAQASKMHYGKYTNFTLYILAEIAIAATDLAEVLGMAIGLNLLFGMPLLLGISISVFDTFLILLLQKAGVRKFEAFIIAIVGIIGIAFVFEMIYSKPDITGIFMGLNPKLPDSNALYIAIGIIGATVMPHNLYLHTALVQSRKIKSDKKSLKEAIKANIIDTGIALNLALFVNAGILILAAATFHKNGLYDVAEIQDAYRYLEPLLGTSYARILFAVALIAAGQSSTLTGTLSGQIVMEGYLNIRLQPWLRRLITRLLAIIPAVIVIYIFGESMTGELLILSQVILSLQLGFAVIPLIHFVSSKKLMGSFAIKKPTKILGWFFTLVIVVLNLKLVSNEMSSWYESGLDLFWFPVIIIIIIGLIVLLVILTLKPIISNHKKQRYHNIHGEIIQDELIISDKKFDNICVSIDFTKFDTVAINAALKLSNENSVLTLIHVVESTSARVYGEDANDFETAGDLHILEKYKENLSKYNVNCLTHIAYGKPSEQLPIFINKNNFDVLVIARHGHKWFLDILLGTTISKVRHKIKTPMLIV